MKKIIILISILALSATVAFAQTSSIDSIRAKSTAGLFTSDSDDISSSGIYGLDSSFASLGYAGFVPVPAFGIAITPSMYLGFTGSFTAPAGIRRETITPDIAGNRVETKSIVGDDSTFFIAAAFGLNKMMGFQYTIAKNGEDTKSDTIKKSITDTTYEQTVNENATDSSWKHEIAFAMKLANEMELNIPVGVIINNDGYTKDTTTFEDGQTRTVNTLGRKTDGTKVTMALKPSFTLPLNLGVFSKVKLGAEAKFAVINNTGEYKQTSKIPATSTDLATETVIEQAKNVDTKDLSWNISATPTFEFNVLDNNTLNLVLEPTVAFNMGIVSNGKTQNVSTTVTTGGVPFVTIDPNTDDVITTTKSTTSLAIPVAAVYSPVEWFELRAGFAYNVSWIVTDTKTNVDAGGEHTTSNYDVDSTITPALGFGFIVADDLFIDLAVGGANFSTTGLSFTEVSLQLSYRF